MSGDDSNRSKDLRKRAEAIVAQRAWSEIDCQREELERICHELRIHQVELELQNEELQVTQTKLLESRDAYARLYDEAPVGYLTVDQRGMIVQVNETFASMIGRERASLLGWSFADLLDDESKAVYVARFKAFFKQPASKSMELKLSDSAQDDRWVSLTGRNVDGRGLATVRSNEALCLFIVNDITDRIQAEESRRKMDEQLQRAQRLESLGLLAGGVAHDFNNLLLSIIGNTELVMEDVGDDASVQPFLKDVLEAGHRAAELCQQMLAYAGKSVLRTVPVSLNEVLHGHEAVLRSSVKKRIPLLFELAEGLPYVDGDSAQLGQVLVNLVTNAAEALEGHDGTITVITECRYVDSQFLERTIAGKPLPADDYVVLEVRDTGCGMDGETLAQVFDPFFTTKFLGRGLGMAAVLGIVHAHGGFIHVTSQLEQGTTITVGFPRSDEMVSPVSASQRLVVPWRSSGSILVIDDEEAARLVLRRMLGRLGFTVVETDDGQAGVDAVTERLESGQDMYRAIVLDWSMPVMDGFEAYRAIRAAAGPIPILLSSGYDEQEAMSQYPRDEKLVFLKKPFSLAALTQRLKALTS